MKAHQRLIREERATLDADDNLFGAYWDDIDIDIARAVIKQVNYETAKSIILEYEWLGTMGRGDYCFGIYFDDMLGGVVCFGEGASLTAGNFCGEDYGDLAICLERGACIHWAHPHSASKLISSAVKIMSETTKYRLFYAYSDESAGEIGTVYQACNWYYIGRMASGGSQTKLISPNGKKYDQRHIMTYAKPLNPNVKDRVEAKQLLKSVGWKTTKDKPKHKYITFGGKPSEIRRFKKALKYPIMPYPKRYQPCDQCTRGTGCELCLTCSYAGQVSEDDTPATCRKGGFDSRAPLQLKEGA